MSRRHAKARRRKRRVKRPRKPAEQHPTYAQEALWTSLSAAALDVGIVCYVVWSFRVHGYAHIYLSVILIAFLMTIVAALFVSLWWSQRRKRKRRHSSARSKRGRLDG